MVQAAKLRGHPAAGQSGPE